MSICGVEGVGRVRGWVLMMGFEDTNRHESRTGVTDTSQKEN